jgi:hypothetical protein
MTRFNWTPERLADLRRLYLDEQRGPVEIARYFGDGCNCVTISSAVSIHNMRRPRTASNGFNWTPEATETLRQLYLDPWVTSEMIAAKLGNGCTKKAVISKAAMLKLKSPRTHLPRPKPLGRVQRIRPMNPDKARFIGWFRRAGWPASEVAWLFDVQPEQVAA